MANELEHGWVDGMPDYWDHEKAFCKKHDITERELRNNRQWRQQAYAEHEALTKQAANQMALKLIEEHEGKYVYFFEYGDESGGIFAELEHENNWGGLPHIRISKH